MNELMNTIFTFGQLDWKCLIERGMPWEVSRSTMKGPIYVRHPASGLRRIS